jgi:predicted nucleic acid-binding Zn ribbon protein
MTDSITQQADVDRLARELHAPHRLCPVCRAAVTLADQLRMTCPHCRATILPGPDITPERGRSMLATLEARRAAMRLMPQEREQR